MRIFSLDDLQRLQILHHRDFFFGGEFVVREGVAGVAVTGVLGVVVHPALAGAEAVGDGGEAFDLKADLVLIVSVFVSFPHDRAFIDRVATEVIVLGS